MLKRIEIKGFRSCHDVVLDDLGPLTVLVGRNAVGKTNILRAIQDSADLACGKTRQFLQVPQAAFEAVLNSDTYRYSIQFDDAATVETLDRDPPAVRVFSRQNETISLWGVSEQVSIGRRAPAMPALASIMPIGSSPVGLLRPLLSFLERFRYYPLESECLRDEIGGLVSAEYYDEWIAQYETANDPGTCVLARLVHMSRVNEPQFDELVSLLGAKGLGLVDDIFVQGVDAPLSDDRATGANKWYWVMFRPSGQNQYFTFGDLAAGTRRTIRLLVSMIFDQSSVMLIEHPEDSIHRGLLRKLIDVLRTYSDQSQLIISSHSSVVFNALDPKAIRLVTMEDGRSKVRPLTNDELSAASSFMEEEGSLSEFIETVEED